MNTIDEELIWELLGEEEEAGERALPLGFRFHPTDEELITFYLTSKVFNSSLAGAHFIEVDLNRCEPWELPEMARMGEKEWYFFSLRDRKYPTGLRTNRATGAGYWKATGKDREVRAGATGALVGMKKTLVFYKGRAPRSEKTKWVLHEYRLAGDLSFRRASKDEWVICRILHKTGGEKKSSYYPNPSCLLGPSSSSSTPFLPPFLELQTLESQMQDPNLPLLLQVPSNCPTSSIPTPKDPLLQEELEISLLQNPLLSDMGFGPLGLPFGLNDLPFMGPAP